MVEIHFYFRAFKFIQLFNNYVNRSESVNAVKQNSTYEEVEVDVFADAETNGQADAEAEAESEGDGDTDDEIYEHDEENADEEENVVSANGDTNGDTDGETHEIKEENTDEKEAAVGANANEENESERIPCSSCDKTFSTKSNMNAHMRSVHLGHRWTCSHDGCEQKCVSKQSLKRHIERIHTQPTGPILDGSAGNERDANQADELMPIVENENDGKNESTDNGQMAKIRRLEADIKSKDLMIDALTKAYSSLKEENEMLKATLVGNQPTQGK